MKVSLNTIKQYIDFELPPVDELVRRINERLGGVEEVIDLAGKYKNALIVKVVECEKHPNADKLSVCKIDAGTSELITVVCGAPNVHADMWAVWLPPESIVPATYGTAEPFTLGARELRGVMSNGMLAAGDELGINSDHDGIVEITEADLPLRTQNLELRTGQNFAEVFGLDDTIIDIENKMFTHRPDLFGQLGVAREIAGIFGKQFTSPEWYTSKSQEARVKSQDDELALEVFNDVPDKAPRFMAVAIKDVTVGPSPLWLQCELVRLGGKPINNIVDITNYVMLLTAQPTHAYDYNKLRAGQEQSQEAGDKSQAKKLGVRMARDGEKALLLNGKTYELSEDDIVIVDGKGPVGLAGIMGGRDSEVSSETKNIVLEVANFDMYAVRKSSMRHGLFTDALTRFNKGQSPLQNAVVLDFLQHMIVEITGGQQATEVFDATRQEVRGKRQEFAVRSEFVNQRLGTELSAEEMVSLLRNVEFAISTHDSKTLTHIPPFWRTDIVDSEDVVEEIGRLYGFDKLPRELPTRSIAPASTSAKREVTQAIRESLSRAGANEVLTYSFVHENVLKKAEQDVNQAFRLSNALSPDLQYYRLSVLPSLLDKVHMNIKAGHDEFVLFEIGKGHNKKYHATDDEGLPTELEFVDAVYASKKPRTGAAYFYVRRLVEQLCGDLGFELVYKPLTEPLDFPVTAPFDQARSALLETRDGQFIGMIGELKQSVARSFKLPEYTAAITLDLEGIQNAYETKRQTYKPLSRFPSTSQDISLRGDSRLSYSQVFKTVWQAAAEGSHGIDIKIKPVTIYSSGPTEPTSTTFRLTFTSHERTLTDTDIKPIMDHIASVALAELGAERI
ncbi:MAG: phenylalanine--tRNA ligase subunit beta [Candidatus Saccharimonas sp.]